jgi:hypothetical protein
MLITTNSNSRKQTIWQKFLTQNALSHNNTHNTPIFILLCVGVVAAVSYVPLVTATATTASCSIKWWSYQNMSPRSKL